MIFMFPILSVFFYIFASDFFYNIIHKTNKYNIGVLNNRNTLNYNININRN